MAKELGYPIRQSGNCLIDDFMEDRKDLFCKTEKQALKSFDKMEEAHKKCSGISFSRKDYRPLEVVHRELKQEPEEGGNQLWLFEKQA